MENNRKILLGAANVMLAILLILLALFLYGGLSTGWFASNKEVTANGMTVKAQGPRLGNVTAKVAVSRNGKSVSKEELLPGDVITVTAEIPVPANGDGANAKIPVEFFLRTPPDVPASGKVPAKIADLPVTYSKKEAEACQAQKGSYYLSTQIYVKTVLLREKGGKGSNILKTAKAVQDKDKVWLSQHQLVWAEPMPVQPEIPLGKLSGVSGFAPSIQGNKVYELQQGKTYELVLTLVFADSATENQSPLRGKYRKEVGGQVTACENTEVIPSSFRREIVVNEIY